MILHRSLVALFFAGALAACATPYAPQDFDFSALEGQNLLAAGTVEQVQQVALPSRLQTFAELFEHSVRPASVDRLHIRLDDGRAVTLEHDGTRRFEAGQRVRVYAHANGTHIERE